MVDSMFDVNNWRAVPFHFWSVAFFIFGAMTGSFLNVCIYRMPRGESVVSPPSHCPHCNYRIPAYLNIPLVTWLYLRAKCANCRAPISIRYFLIEFLTAVLFMACWWQVGQFSVLLALAYCLVMSGLIVATFIDLEHFIIPDEITIGGIVVGFVVSLLVPVVQGTSSSSVALKQSLLGILVGGGLIYGILRAGKLLFGKQRIELTPGTRIVFTETSLKLPDEEIPFEDLFYRDSDFISLEATHIELADRCYAKATVRLTPTELQIGDDIFKPEDIPHMEAVADRIVLPREAMGFGDVKFMAAIGAFLGWPAVLFSLMMSSIIGALVGLALIAAKKQEWSSRLPYGPYIALAAMLWVFRGPQLMRWIFGAAF